VVRCLLGAGVLGDSLNKHNSTAIKTDKKTPTSWVVLRHELAARRPQEKHSKKKIRQDVSLM